MKRLKEIIICLAISWIFVSPIVIAISYTHGWKIGFEACSTVWTENVDSIIHKIKTK